MSAAVQLTLFELPALSIEELSEDLASVKSQMGNLRRGLFARHEELSKELSSLRADINLLLNAIEGIERQTFV